jgi:hypothetical protein
MFINKELISQFVFKDLINDNSSAELVKGILIENISTQALEFIMHVIINPEFELLYPGDYFACKVEKKWIGHYFEIDHLIDLGLYKDGYVYGKVVDSDSYGDQFEPYHYTMKVDLCIHNEDLKMIYKRMTLSTCNLIKLDKSNIQYFNHGTD